MNVDVSVVRRTDVSLHMTKEEWLIVQAYLVEGRSHFGTTAPDDKFIYELISSVTDNIQFEEGDA